MSYDNPYNLQKYSYVATVSSATDESFRGPAGKRGRLYDWGAEGASTDFDDTLAVSVGVPGGDVDAYGDEVNVTCTATSGTDSVRTQFTNTVDDEATLAALFVADIPADTAFSIHGDGNPTAGAGTLFCIVAWED